MVRRSKLLLLVVVVGVSAGIALAYFGMIESIVAPDQLPGPPAAAPPAIIAVGVTGLLTAGYLDRRAWKQAGKQAGLTAGGGPQFATGPPDWTDKPTLSGTVDGRPVRAWTFSSNRRRGKQTQTVVEAELDTAVDWHASVGTPRAERGPDDHPVDAAAMQVVDGVGVRGDISEELARELLTPDVRDAVASVDGELSVGSVTDNLMSDMREALDGEAGGIAGTMAEGMMRMAGGGDDGPSLTVEHRGSGLLTDGETLRRRLTAVTALADAVEETTAAESPR